MIAIDTFMLEEGFENARELLIGRKIVSAPKLEYFSRIVRLDSDYLYLENKHKIPEEEWGKCMIPLPKPEHARA